MLRRKWCNQGHPAEEKKIWNSVTTEMISAKVGGRLTSAVIENRYGATYQSLLFREWDPTYGTSSSKCPLMGDQINFSWKTALIIMITKTSIFIIHLVPKGLLLTYPIRVTIQMEFARHPDRMNLEGALIATQIVNTLVDCKRIHSFLWLEEE